MTRLKYLLFFLMVLCLLYGCGKKQEKVPDPGLYAKMETTKGNFIIQLEYKLVPMLVANFVGLAEGVFRDENPKESGFFDNTYFYEVVNNVLIKCGMPAGENSSLPGYYLPENYNPGLLHDRTGTVSMLQTGNEQISSYQFSISLRQVNWLDFKQPVFGYVIDGIEVLNKISARDILKKVTILRIGKNAEAFVVTKEIFNSLKNDVEKANREAGSSMEDEALGILKKTYPDLVQTREGIWFSILKNGAGTPPAVGTVVDVKYTGTLLDGTVFMDTSGEEGGIKKLILGKVIKGLDGALQTMRKGEHRIVVIPPNLGFGKAGLAPLIPPDAFLIFDVELINF
ncbi:MAG: peptidylprolyl isomerase [Spirochaetales bacterium]|nr:peptidylprolyl isomerase [Spirochaetales bacterium]